MTPTPRPSFSLETTWDLRPPLKNLGVRAPFDPAAADFTPLSGKKRRGGGGGNGEGGGCPQLGAGGGTHDLPGVTHHPPTPPPHQVRTTSSWVRSCRR